MLQPLYQVDETFLVTFKHGVYDAGRYQLVKRKVRRIYGLIKGGHLYFVGRSRHYIFPMMQLLS